jgi:hypothetical protein
MIIRVDIDNTICKYNKGNTGNYQEAIPIKKNIQLVNNLYLNGHEIIYWTSRGVITGIDWQEITKKQFNIWGVLYTTIELNKPYYDLFIDDKNLNSITDFTENKINSILGIK